ncbi:flagellar motor switch protein FliM [Arenivirga flava]|uniref:Flagellar motor switch protein FliM n=1 Tax=Arenivirga flava TaxID=1930060 RepID=A0AA37UT38_9MICO|nr:flagellar motor switch protein FliM [Arenivirga flava]
MIEVYDFSRPTTLARHQSRVLEVAFETFARQWGTELTAKVRVMSQVGFSQLTVQTYDAFAASLPSITAMVLLDLEGQSARAVIQFPTAAALGWISSMLGGSGVVAPPDRRFTPIEQSLIRNLMDDAIEDLEYSFGALLTDNVSIDSIHYNSQFAQAAAPSDLMLVAEFEVRVGDSSSPATVALPLGAVLPRLGNANAVERISDAPERLREHLDWAPVEVALRLAPLAVTPRAILDLAVGDVLSLPHAQHRPFEVSVHGTPIARAAAGAVGSRLAGVIVDTEESS